MNIAIICRQGIYERLSKPLTDGNNDVIVSPPLFQWNEALKYMQGSKVDGIVVEAGVSFFEQIKTFPLPCLIYAGENQGYSKKAKDWIQALLMEMDNTAEQASFEQADGNVEPIELPVIEEVDAAVLDGIKVAVVSSNQQIVEIVNSFSGVSVVSTIDNFQAVIDAADSDLGVEVIFVEEGLLASENITIRELKIIQLVESYKSTKVRLAIMLFERKNPAFFNRLVKIGFYDFLSKNNVSKADIERLIKVPRTKKDVSDLIEVESQTATVNELSQQEHIAGSANESSVNESENHHHKLIKASEAVEKAETSLLESDVESAISLLKGLREVDRLPLEERLETVQSTIKAATAYKDKVEKAVAVLSRAENSKKADDIEAAGKLILELKEPDQALYRDRLEVLQKILDYQLLFNKALASVVKAETSKLLQDLNGARSIVSTLNRSHAEALINRLDIVQTAIDKAKEYEEKLEFVKNAILKAERTVSRSAVEEVERLIADLQENDRTPLINRLNVIKQQIDENESNEKAIKSEQEELLNQQSSVNDSSGDASIPAYILSREEKASSLEKVTGRFKEMQNSFRTRFIGGKKKAQSEESESGSGRTDKEMMDGTVSSYSDSLKNEENDAVFTYPLPHRVVIYSPKGGAGTTSISVHLTRTSKNNSVGLAEIAYSYGQLAGRLDLKPKYTIADIEEGMEEIAVCNQMYLCSPWVYPVKKTFDEVTLKEWLNRAQRAFPGRTVLVDLQSQSSPLLLMSSHEWATRVIWVVHDTEEHLGMADLQLSNLKKMGEEWKKIGIFVQEVTGKKIAWEDILGVPVIGKLKQEIKSKKWQQSLHEGIEHHLGLLSR